MSICDNCIHRLPCDNESDYRKQCIFYEEERKQGKWIDHSDEGYVECPFCDHATTCNDDIDELHYCFFCGASLGKKDGEENDKL